MNYQQSVEQKIEELKAQPFPSVVLSERLRRTDFTLEFLTRDVEQDKQIISVLSRWRKKHESWFPAIFPISSEGTKRWYRTRLMDVPDRLLFIIRVHGTYIGHVGLYRFQYSHQICDIDNIVRGRKGYPGIMEEAIRLLMRWGKETFAIRSYTLSTFADNKKALSLYMRLGFVEVKQEPLYWAPSDGGGSWETWEEGNKKTVGRYYVYMERKI